MAKPKPALQVRSPKNADDFVAGRGVSAASTQPLAADAPPPAVRPALGSPPAPPIDEAPAPPAKLRGLVQRAGGEERARITVYLAPDVAQKLRRHCFENGLQVSDLAALAIARYVAKL